VVYKLSLSWARVKIVLGGGIWGGVKGMGRTFFQGHWMPQIKLLCFELWLLTLFLINSLVFYVLSEGCKWVLLSVAILLQLTFTLVKQE